MTTHPTISVPVEVLHLDHADQQVRIIFPSGADSVVIDGRGTVSIQPSGGPEPWLHVNLLELVRHVAEAIE